MRRFKYSNIIFLEESVNIKVSKYFKILDIFSEVLIVMLYYCVSIMYLFIKLNVRLREKVWKVYVRYKIF